MRPQIRSFPIDPYYRNNTVCALGYHEVGHYVIARALGFKTGSLKLKMLDLNGGHIGGSIIEPVRALSGVDDILKFLEARVQVLYAGALAQSLSNGKADDEVAVSILENGGGQMDFGKARELIHLIRNIKFPNAVNDGEIQLDLDEINNDLWDRAKVLVEKDHEVICGLGRRLASGLNETGKEFELSEAELETLPAIQKRFR